ncbi:MAG: UDP-N-acetylmuramate dehydrogenase [Victivallales bacterium]|nr:UDP-N-acetylmuramate dehydrogenase [Victivallales bacterium]
MNLDSIGKELTNWDAEAEVQVCRWADVTTLGVGLGRFYRVAPHSICDLKNILQYINNKQVNSIVIGAGSNLVGSDEDYDGVVLDLRKCCGEIRQDGAVFTVGSAVPLLRLVKFAAEQGYGGISKLCGIPGQLGGVVTMNAGALGQEICTSVLELRGMLAGQEWSWQPTMSDWGYRHCKLPVGVVLTEIVLKLIEVIPEEENALIFAELHRRADVTPKGRSAGSVFRNPPGQFAGSLLEQCGCKGLSIGNLHVSVQHANWIVKEGNEPGLAADCRSLVEEMRRRVLEQFGVLLETEWRWV